MMHVIIADDLYDADYVARYTVGFDALTARVAEWTPARASRHHRRGCRALIREAGPRLCHHAAGGHPHQLRHAAPPGRRHGRAHRRLPARAGGRGRDVGGGITLSTSGGFAHMDRTASTAPICWPNAHPAPST
ncbi:MAG: hypothetical protein R3A10_07875 [Caldilineaceae bacterium]